MAESQQVSAFPLPPMQYVNHFTDENVKRGRVPPPPQPMEDTYTMFGNGFTSDDQVIRPLESQGFRRLHPQAYDHKRELKKLNHSILANFLDLLDILIKAPESAKRHEKLEDLNLLFIHIHHLINEFRPHQARETLRVMMELQKKKRDEISEKFQGYLDKVKDLIQASANSLPDDFSLDSKVLVKSEILTSEMAADEQMNGTGECDQLDRMMCDIVEGM